TAEDYDRQWSATRLPQYLYEAGLAYEAAGYDAHAITRWNQYLDEKKQVSASARAEIERRITEAKVRTVPVIVHLLPPEVTKEGVKARFRYLSGTEGSEAKNPFFNLNIQTSSQAVDLDPGEWEIRVDAPGF